MSEQDSVAPKPKKSVALSGVVAGNTALRTVSRTGNGLHYRGSRRCPPHSSLSNVAAKRL